MNTEMLFIAKGAAWLVAAVALLARKNGTGRVAMLVAILTGLAAIDGARPVALGLLPAAGMHLLLAIPDGKLYKSMHRGLVLVSYAVGAGAAALLTSSDMDTLVLAVEATALLALAIGPSASRYRASAGLARQRLQWFGWAVTVGAGIALIAAALRLLLGWPDDARAVVVASTIWIPFGLAFGGSPRIATRIDRLLAHTVAIAGLAGVVVASYVLIVVGLGRVPSVRERTIIGLSMVAAAVAAVLYLPTRDRLGALANRIVYGERKPPDEVLRTFGTRLSRAIPMDELLLQLAESLRRTLSLDSAEIWTGSNGVYDRSVTDPEREPIRLHIGEKELPVVARAGVVGPAWLKIWLPALVAGREESMMRVAPISHSGELLGLIVVERREWTDPFGDENERVLAELARQVALALHNVQLDSALQASLEDLKKHAEDLRRSRERIVATADAERRKIERNLHDGAQQHLVALKVKLRLVKDLSDKDPATARAMLEELSGDVQQTIEELRALSHGIYPKVLADRGLIPALEGAAVRAAIPTSIEANGSVRRHRQEVEAAVYFCVLEALQNAAKHAGDGAFATVSVCEEDGHLRFAVVDNGVGFDQSASTDGAGLTNMTDRLGAIGGSVRWESAPGRGMTVEGRIPI